ncbi:MAG: S8 family serine peptidase, partial [Anaerolineaceae bacterium]
MKTTTRILSLVAVGGLLALALGTIPVQAQSGGSTQGVGTGSFYTYLPFIVRDYRPYGGIITPNDPFFNNLDDTWAYNNTGVFGETADADIDAPEAWGYTTGSSSVIVAIVDSGIDTTHPEFSGRLLPGMHYYHLNSTSYSDTNVTDENGHGTHVAGIAAAAGNNGIGGVGVAWQVRILPVRVL